MGAFLAVGRARLSALYAGAALPGEVPVRRNAEEITAWWGKRRDVYYGWLLPQSAHAWQASRGIWRRRRCGRHGVAWPAKRQ